ncbi:MAG: hypothetical protein JJE55_14215, partial [Flavobacteriaceae bacterium]|nr:hypothetical protein [Flavobacteriaceae bacterium]
KRTETTGTKRTVIGPAKQLKVAQIEPKCLALTDRNHWHHLIRVIQRTFAMYELTQQFVKIYDKGKVAIANVKKRQDIIKIKLYK